MKKNVDVEKLDLGEIFQKGLSVRDQFVQEWKETRDKMAQVNWRNELEAFKKNPLDTCQTYLNQVSDALKQRTMPVDATPEPKKPVQSSSDQKKSGRTSSPRIEKAKSTTKAKKSRARSQSPARKTVAKK